MKKILITGSNGRIGKDLKEFLGVSYEIIELEKGDKLSAEKFQGIYAIIHLAALTPQKDKDFILKEYLEVNVELTKQVLFYAAECKIKLVIIPTSWSWMFKTGPYQYSKLVQEKIANKYKELGLNVVTIEFPEVINSEYKGVIQTIIENIENNHETTVDRTDITTITTKDIARVFEKFIDGKNKAADKLYKKSLKTFDLYGRVKEVIQDKFPSKLKYLKGGINKVTTPVANKNKTIIFPDFEIE